MNKHILLEYAHCYDEPRTVSYPINYNFSDEKGYWLNSQGEALMLSKDARLQRTKKEDRETGEDQKGE